MAARSSVFGGLAALLVVVALTACTTVPLVSPGPRVDPAQRARTLEGMGDYVGAADEYMRLARSAAPSARSSYFLRAAESFIAGGKPQAAGQALDQARAYPLEPAMHTRFQLAQAHVALSAGDPQAALSALQGLSDPLAPAALKSEVHVLRAAAWSRTGHPVEAARERIVADPLLIDPRAIRDNQQALWETLTSLPETSLAQLAARHDSPWTDGWLELVRLYRAHRTDPDTLEWRLAQWRTAHTAHPVTSAFLDSLVDRSRQIRSRPARIALLLPVTGPVGQAAAAVRDGFFAAYYFETRSQRPVITVKPTNAAAESVLRAYRQALDEGATSVVGPLGKEEVQTLARNAAVTVPTLALNYTPESDPLPEGFYEFGLSPEDEARQVAEQAWLDGRTRVLALTQDGDWGERVYRAFEKRWTQLGGQVLAREVFAAGEDLSPRVRDLLQFRRSQGATLAAASRSYQGRYDGSPQGDFLFMVALPDQARQIGPRLRYYGTADLPVYATSHAFAGRPDRDTLRDLEGVVFLDLPWVLSPESADAGLRTQVAQAWPDQFDTYQRLYALGVDAYRLLPYLSRLAHEPSARLSGVTGSLRIEDGHRVVREARWARVESAQVRLLQENEHWRP